MHKTASQSFMLPTVVGFDMTAGFVAGVHTAALETSAEAIKVLRLDPAGHPAQRPVWDAVILA